MARLLETEIVDATVASADIAGEPLLPTAET
jgi:hypothetical protein